MRCPSCNSEKTSVIDSRSAPDHIRRRRSCMECDYRFTTYERIEEQVPMLVKKDGRREAFDRNKVRAGLVKACEKRPVSVEDIDRIVAEIEQDVAQMDEREVSSQVLGELLMKYLRDLDQVAYVRFASVYREFSEISQFVETLQSLLENTDSKSGIATLKQQIKA